MRRSKQSSELPIDTLRAEERKRLQPLGHILPPTTAPFEPADRATDSAAKAPTAAPGDIQALRARARQGLEDGAVTAAYGGDPETTIAILQTVLATELVCVLRYTQHSVAANGLASQSVKREFAEHAKEEHGHALAVAERITQLGGTPNFDPEGLAARSASQFMPGVDLVDMIRENLVAERIAVEHYRELVRHFSTFDPTTRLMLETILAVEEEHAADMHDLLEARRGPG